MTVAPCVRCGHGADEHRLPDDLSPVGPGAVFPCVVDGCSCGDYVDEPLRRTKKAETR